MHKIIFNVCAVRASPNGGGGEAGMKKKNENSIPVFAEEKAECVQTHTHKKSKTRESGNRSEKSGASIEKKYDSSSLGDRECARHRCLAHT